MFFFCASRSLRWRRQHPPTAPVSFGAPVSLLTPTSSPPIIMVAPLAALTTEVVDLAAALGARSADADGLRVQLQAAREAE